MATGATPSAAEQLEVELAAQAPEPGQRQKSRSAVSVVKFIVVKVTCADG